VLDVLYNPILTINLSPVVAVSGSSSSSSSSSSCCSSSLKASGSIVNPNDIQIMIVPLYIE
jgi:hypothetical protein